ncbi:MarR family transcriptional regulator [Actinoplanes sp. NBRC 14428]|uniref:DNA-binding MarR family transcriptional regulator n=1 Tax=Pseudosporangium ferrugineum TaxID=439699 RepID=A0A2T0RXB8_9ACTN|nr:MarR family transcriptional regulator [Pseudosporangium ferrugineum]PRY25836.1 DNA-binding MarR family transcriptional regulator [Pseudosporangium ferrugineum]BCJ56110.1 MarR family transcriptional regulator [Actinoplanes sp. NBRC 14428]
MDGRDEPRWLSPEESDAWISLCWLMVKFPGEFEAQLQRDSGLSFFEYLVLSALSMVPGRRLRMNELAQHVNGSVTRLSNVAKRLEQRGWITRVPWAENGRFIEAILTDEGMAVVQRAAPGHVAAVRHHVFDALSDEQVNALREIGRRIADRVEAGHAGSRAWRPAPDRTDAAG